MPENEELIIRYIRKGDFSIVSPLLKQLAAPEGGDYLFRKSDFLDAGFGRKKRFRMLLALHKKKPVGYISFHPGYDLQSASSGFYLIDMFVKEQYRHKKVGKRLMSAVAKISKQLGGTWVSWHVRPGNVGAIAFYERLGAKRTRSLHYVLEI